MLSFLCFMQKNESYETNDVNMSKNIFVADLHY